MWPELFNVITNGTYRLSDLFSLCCSHFYAAIPLQSTQGMFGTAERKRLPTSLNKKINQPFFEKHILAEEAPSAVPYPGSMLLYCIPKARTQCSFLWHRGDKPPRSSRRKYTVRDRYYIFPDICGYQVLPRFQSVCTLQGILSHKACKQHILSFRKHALSIRGALSISGPHPTFRQGTEE